jgi:hypothetical protein
MQYLFQVIIIDIQSCGAVWAELLTASFNKQRKPARKFLNRNASEPLHSICVFIIHKSPNNSTFMTYAVLKPGLITTGIRLSTFKPVDDDRHIIFTCTGHYGETGVPGDV